MRLVPGGSLQRPAPRFNSRLRSHRHPCARPSLRRRTAQQHIGLTGEGRLETRAPGCFPDLKSPANTRTKPLHLGLQDFDAHLPPSFRSVVLSAAFATPLEIPSPLQHSRPSIFCMAVVCRPAAAVRLRVPSLRSGSLGRRGPGLSSVVTAPPTAFKGGREATPSYRPAPRDSCSGCALRAGFAEDGCSRRPRAPLRFAA